MTLNKEIMNAKALGIDLRFKTAENTFIIDFNAEIRMVDEDEYNELVGAGYKGYVLEDHTNYVSNYLVCRRTAYYVEEGAY